MNKTAMKNFAVWARTKLREDITYKAGLLGVSEKGIAEALPESSQDLQFFDIGTKAYGQAAGNEIKQRNALVNAIQEKERTSDYKTAFDAIIEEVAYTWFNRLIAIRLMEVNDYLPSRVRVLSSETPGKNEPDMVTAPFDTDLEFTEAEQEKILQLKDDASSSASDALFRMLFIKQCNKLHEILPELFEETLDYTELLLNISFTDPDGIVYHLVNDIAEEDFDISRQGEDGEAAGQVEIIGWLYQYYNDERKNEIINIYKGTVKKEDIPAATQLFTTDWVVRYMVDNSLGRYWIERHPESKLAEKLAFFVTPKDGQIQYVDDSIRAEDLKFFDPCMGSGHILIYAFEVLMYIYEECGYTERDAASMIVQNNLYGLDIDNRAAQLAYFAIMMKARSYDRRFLSRGIAPNVMAIQESNGIGIAVPDSLNDNAKMKEMSEYLVDKFLDAKEIGSMVSIEGREYETYVDFLEHCDGEEQLTMEFADWSLNTKPVLKKLARQAKLLANQYQVVCTNPPYLNKFEGKLKKFVTENYKDYAGDLFSVFIYRNLMFCTQDGYCGYMSPFVWMFIKTYEKLRNFIIQNKSITTLVQMEYSAFEEATVPICSFVLKNSKTEENGLYFKLSDFKGGMEVQKQKVLEAIADKNCGYFFEANSTNFVKIPGSPVAYWVSERFTKNYEQRKFGEYSEVITGMTIGDNNKYLRIWHEIGKKQIALYACDMKEVNLEENKWIPYSKGGPRRNWYGNYEYVVNWAEKNNFNRSKTTLQHLYLKNGITWPFITSGDFSARFLPNGFLWDVAGSPCFFENEQMLKYALAALCTKCINYILKVVNPTINVQAIDIAQLPLIVNNEKMPNIIEFVDDCIDYSKKDWDSYETSWDFKRNPLV